MKWGRRSTGLTANFSGWLPGAITTHFHHGEHIGDLSRQHFEIDFSKFP
jgi:hypothetical protein